MGQGKTRQRSKPLSQREASRDSKAAAWKKTMDKVLRARRAQETKGVEDVVHKFRDEEACLRKRHLPNCSMVESWLCSGSGSGPGSGRRRNADAQAVGTASSRRTGH